MSLLLIWPYHVKKWPNIILKSFRLNTARRSMYAWPFYNMHGNVGSLIISELIGEKFAMVIWFVCLSLLRILHQAHSSPPSTNKFSSKQKLLTLSDWKKIFYVQKIVMKPLAVITCYLLFLWRYQRIVIYTSKYGRSSLNNCADLEEGFSFLQ